MHVSYGTFPGKSVDEYSNDAMLDGQWMSRCRENMAARAVKRSGGGAVAVWRRRYGGIHGERGRERMASQLQRGV